MSVSIYPLVIFVSLALFVLFVFLMRALLSWWLRTNEILVELRTLNRSITSIAKTQTAILEAIAKQTPPTT